LRAPIFSSKRKKTIFLLGSALTRWRRDYGSRAKNFLPLNPSIFCPLALKNQAEKVMNTLPSYEHVQNLKIAL